MDFKELCNQEFEKLVQENSIAPEYMSTSTRLKWMKIAEIRAQDRAIREIDYL